MRARFFRFKYEFFKNTNSSSFISKLSLKYASHRVNRVSY